MTLTMTAVPLPLRTDNSGTVRVGNTRMSLDIVIDTFKQGADPEREIHQLVIFHGEAAQADVNMLVD